MTGTVASAKSKLFPTSLHIFDYVLMHSFISSDFLGTSSLGVKHRWMPENGSRKSDGAGMNSRICEGET